MAHTQYVYEDKRFYELTVPIAKLECLYDECRWAEGSVWFKDHGYLLWSDIPNRRMLKWVLDLGAASTLKAKNRQLENMLADILSARPVCEVAEALRAKFARASRNC